jgi:hypothetical protein
MSVIRKGATTEYSTGWEKAFGKSGRKSVPMKAAPPKAVATKKAPAKKTAMTEKTMPKAAIAKVTGKGAKAAKKKPKAKAGK